MAGPPVFVDRSTGTGSGSSISLTMPSASSGDVLIAIISCGGGGTMTTTSPGWVKVGEADNGSAVAIAVFAGISGTAGSLAVASTSNTGKAWCVESYSNATSDPGDIETAGNTASATTYDPPSLTPSHGSQEYFWIAAAGGDQDGGWAPSSGPSGWDAFQSITVSGASLGVARQQDTGSSINPGTFGSGRFLSSAYAAVTIAILPLLQVPIDSDGDHLGIAENASRITPSASQDQLDATENASSIQGSSSADDDLGLEENASSVIVTVTADSMALVEDLDVDLTVGIQDILSLSEGTQHIAFPAVLDILELTDQSLVTNLVEAAPDSLTAVEDESEIIFFHIVSDALELADSIDSLAAAMSVSDGVHIDDGTNLTARASDSMLLTDVGFNWGPGLRAKGPRVMVVESERRRVRPRAERRSHTIPAELRKVAPRNS